MANPKIHTQLVVKSGHLCYGELHNLWQGASAEPNQGLPAGQPKPSGTVRANKLDHNVPALNGTWKVIQLIDISNSQLSGWFVAHESVDVLSEVDKILRVSGSPHEEDSGSTFNNEKTAAEGVYVINRYDWGLYDKRALGVVETSGQNEEFDPATYVRCESVGLADYAEAKAEVELWKERSDESRSEGRRPHSVWMRIPGGECKFGRFGFNEDHSAARSFLWFTMDTHFTRTVFSGTQQPLRKEETHEEQFQRRLREGFDFRGMETIKRIFKSHDLDWARPSAEEDWLGPFIPSERLLLEADIRVALRQCPRGLDFVDPWRERVETLLNELLMSYLERYVVPLGQSFDTIVTAAEALTPLRDSTGRMTIDKRLFQLLTDPTANPIPGWNADAWDTPAVADRVRSFFVSHSGGEGALFGNDDFVARLCRCLAYLVNEMLELAEISAVDSYRSIIMPSDIRLAVANDFDLFSALKFSRVFWDGNE
ncbi:MAG: hypothetical protein Q9219_007147 [cf. Caloplaca sp. 3 TL-2023]